MKQTRIPCIEALRWIREDKERVAINLDLDDVRALVVAAEVKRGVVYRELPHDAVGSWYVRLFDGRLLPVFGVNPLIAIVDGARAYLSDEIRRQFEVILVPGEYSAETIAA